LKRIVKDFFSLGKGNAVFLNMEESVLNNKWVLGVNSNGDVLNVLKEKILKAAPNCHFEKATTYQEAFEFLVFFMYDLVILDDALYRSRDLLDFAVNRPFPVPVAILTSHAVTPETLKLSIESGAKIVLPVEKVDDIVPVVEYIVWREQLPPLARFFEDLRESFNARRLFSKSRDYKKELNSSISKNGTAIKKGYKADIIRGWKRSYLKLKNHLNYFESCPEKEINLKWPELKSETEISARSEIKV
jgi:hypothetical protein